MPKSIGSWVLGQVRSTCRVLVSSSCSYSCLCCRSRLLAICSSSSSLTHSNSCGMVVQILLASSSPSCPQPPPAPLPLPIPHSTRLLDQLLQQPNFMLNRIVLSDEALKYMDILDMRCNRELGVLQLGSEFADTDVVDGDCWACSCGSGICVGGRTGGIADV